MVRAMGVFAAFLLVAGCTGGGSGGSGAAPTKLDSPKDTVVTMNAAIESGNRDQFVSCFKATDEQKKALGEMHGMASEMSKLQKAVEKSYGADGAKEFQAALGPSGGGVQALTPEKIAGMKVEEKGDTATVSVPGERQPMAMVKDAGKWLVDVKEMFKDGVTAEQVGKMMATMKEPIGKVLAEVGKPGQTPKSHASTMQSEMMKAMMGAAAQMMPKDAPALPK
jgi:hypothetical protein